MKVSSSSRVGTPSVRKTKGKAALNRSAFSGILKVDTAVATNPVIGSSPIASVDALLSLQEVPDATGQRSKGLAKAQGMLDLLEEIQNGFLLGSIPTTRLRELARLTKDKSNGFNDPKLKNILGDIELRARVELAKLEAHA